MKLWYELHFITFQVWKPLNCRSKIEFLSISSLCDLTSIQISSTYVCFKVWTFQLWNVRTKPYVLQIWIKVRSQRVSCPIWVWLWVIFERILAHSLWNPTCDLAWSVQTVRGFRDVDFGQKGWPVLNFQSVFTELNWPNSGLRLIFELFRCENLFIVHSQLNFCQFLPLTQIQFWMNNYRIFYTWDVQKSSLFAWGWSVNWLKMLFFFTIANMWKWSDFKLNFMLFHFVFSGIF